MRWTNIKRGAWNGENIEVDIYQIKYDECGRAGVYEAGLVCHKEAIFIQIL